MPSNHGSRLDCCEITRLTRRVAEQIIQPLKETLWKELRDVPPSVRRMVLNAAVADVLTVLNAPAGILGGDGDEVLREYGRGFHSFKRQVIGLCNLLHETQLDETREETMLASEASAIGVDGNALYDVAGILILNHGSKRR